MSKLDDDPHEAAKAHGLVVVEPKANELFIDIDNDADRARFGEAMRILHRQKDCPIRGEIVSDEPSKTLNHTHIVVRFDRDLTVMERIALQACLGSDRTRELLSILRVWFTPERPPTVFFEKPTTQDSEVVVAAFADSTLTSPVLPRRKFRDQRLK